VIRKGLYPSARTQTATASSCVSCAIPDAREGDFVVLENRQPPFAVEAKTGERAVSPAIRYFQQRTGIQRWYQVHLGVKDAAVDGVRILPFATLSRGIGIP
jgi:hypothetical protein